MSIGFIFLAAKDLYMQNDHYIHKLNDIENKNL